MDPYLEKQTMNDNTYPEGPTQEKSCDYIFWFYRQALVDKWAEFFTALAPLFPQVHLSNELFYRRKNFLVSFRGFNNYYFLLQCFGHLDILMTSLSLVC